jgi:hypothetical protein
MGSESKLTGHIYADHSFLVTSFLGVSSFIELAGQWLNAEPY